MEITGPDAQQVFRELTGPVDPEIARHLRPHTLRAKFGVDKIKNAFLTILLCAAVILYSFRVDSGFCALPGSSNTCKNTSSTLTATVHPTTAHH